MTEPYVPTEEGFYWFRNKHGTQTIVGVTTRQTVIMPAHNDVWTMCEALEGGIFAPGPLQPPQWPGDER